MTQLKANDSYILMIWGDSKKTFLFASGISFSLSPIFCFASAKLLKTKYNIHLSPPSPPWSMLLKSSLPQLWKLHYIVKA